MKLTKYAESLDCSPSYVVTEALKFVCDEDKQFQSWLSSQHTKSSRKREAPASTPCLVAGTGKAWSRKAGIPRPITCVSGRSVRDTAGRTRRAALVGLQLRQHELQRSAFLLLAQGRASESHQDRGVDESIADAFGAQGCPAGIEIAERLQGNGGFCFSVSSPQRQKAARPCGRFQEEDPTSLCGDRHHRRGLAYFPTHGRSMLAEMGEHQLTIRDYLRHSNLHVTNKYLQATPESKRLAQGKLVEAILPEGLLPVTKSTFIQSGC